MLALLTSPEIIRLTLLQYVRFPLALRNFEDLLLERAIDIGKETVPFWWIRFGQMFVVANGKRLVDSMRSSH